MDELGAVAAFVSSEDFLNKAAGCVEFYTAA
jgi:hypothetical protein